MSHSWQVQPTWMCTELEGEFTSQWSTLEPPGPWSCSALSLAGWRGCWEQVRPWWSVRAATAWSCRQRWRCWMWSSRPGAPCPSTSPQPTAGLTPCPSMNHMHVPSRPHIRPFKRFCFFQGEDGCRGHRGHRASSAAAAEGANVCRNPQSWQHWRLLWAGGVRPGLHTLHPAGWQRLGPQH